MKIIGLVGPSNSGKTTTITRLRDELLAQGAVELEPRYQPEPEYPEDDFWIILCWKGEKIVLASPGDEIRNHIIKHLIQFSDCDKLVLAISIENNASLSTQKHRARYWLEEYPDHNAIVEKNIEQEPNREQAEKNAVAELLEEISK